MREKITLGRKMHDEQANLAKGYSVKSLMQEQEKEDFLLKEYKEIAILKQDITQKQANLQQLKQYIITDYDEKKNYEQ